MAQLINKINLPVRLFVYGTLRSGGVLPITELLDHSISFLGKAKVKGKIYQVDYYPGLILNENTPHVVIGELYLLEDILHLYTLNEYEGICDPPTPQDLYRLAICRAVLEDGTELECITYEYNRKILPSMPLIESGDYLRYISE